MDEDQRSREEARRRARGVFGRFSSEGDTISEFHDGYVWTGEPADVEDVTRERAAAWDAVHAALERWPGWEATRPSWRVDEWCWLATAIDARPLRRGRRRDVVEARAATEAEALRELATALDERARTER